MKMMFTIEFYTRNDDLCGRYYVNGDCKDFDKIRKNCTKFLESEKVLRCVRILDGNSISHVQYKIFDEEPFGFSEWITTRFWAPAPEYKNM